MKSGINEEKVNNLKVELLDYIESMNSISNSINSNIEIIRNNIDGQGKNEILSKLTTIKEQCSNMSSNINTYIDDLGKVVSSYVAQDQDAATTLISNISRLEEGSE